MTRRTTVNRVHRTARRTTGKDKVRPRAVKTIDKARELIIAMVPRDSHVYLYAKWSDYRTKTYSNTEASYDCRVYGPGVVLLCEVASPTPTGLVAAVYRALQEPPQPRQAPPHDAGEIAVTRQRVIVREPISGEMPPAAGLLTYEAPRLPAPPVPRLTNGGCHEV